MLAIIIGNIIHFIVFDYLYTKGWHILDSWTCTFKWQQYMMHSGSSSSFAEKNTVNCVDYNTENQLAW